MCDSLDMILQVLSAHFNIILQDSINIPSATRVIDDFRLKCGTNRDSQGLHVSVNNMHRTERPMIGNRPAFLRNQLVDQQNKFKALHMV